MLAFYITRQLSKSLQQSNLTKIRCANQISEVSAFIRKLGQPVQSKRVIATLLAQLPYERSVVLKQTLSNRAYGGKPRLG